MEGFYGENAIMKKVLTIAGSDSGGGAGIQADLKTMLANGVYGMSVITALTAQNTMGVDGIYAVTPEFVGMQIDSVFRDLRPDAVKIGMVFTAEIVRVIAEKLQEYGAENVVVDPVMVSTSGSKLISDEAVREMKEALFPLADIITPNIPEAEILSGISIQSEDDMIKAAQIICSVYDCDCLLKGGHQINTANDLLYYGGNAEWFRGKRVNNPNTHGTGCTLSSAIASNLAKGFTLSESVGNAKEYLTAALEAMLDLGSGSGPVDHGCRILQSILP